MSDPLVKIPFKDPLVKSYYDFYYSGLIDYEYLKKTLHDVEEERIQKLEDEGMRFEQALDEVIDDMYAINVQEFCEVVPF